MDDFFLFRRIQAAITVLPAVKNDSYGEKGEYRKPTAIVKIQITT